VGTHEHIGQDRKAHDSGDRNVDACLLARPVHRPVRLDYSHGTLPTTLHEATQAMKKSSVAKEILGEGFTEHFVQTREWEWRQHLKPVTDWK